MQPVDKPLIGLKQTHDEIDFDEIVRGMINDDGLAAKQHLAEGRPIYYGDKAFPEGIVKRYPDGKRQLVSVTLEGVISVIRDI